MSKRAVLDKSQKLPKSERLSNRKIIQELFDSNSSSFFFYPFKFFFLVDEGNMLPHYPQVLFIVPKKRFRRAHDRHYLRRRMKEAYRLHKYDFFHDLLPPWRALAIVYVGKTLMDFHQIEEALCKAFARFKQSL
ncbi:ribonuclease P protein component [Thermonema rossianum]|jgi:ribonuclease P protein component|uniref:ribonuclease P protein component n=1 Tax=Thermonema rossianum TaxID=55505 RepID=UPI0005708DD2|nr:ribonuclease P protein component [Thermonema rossianum]